MEEYVISINGKPKFRCPSRIDAEVIAMLLTIGKRVDPVEAKLQAIRANIALAEMEYRKLRGDNV